MEMKYTRTFERLYGVNMVSELKEKLKGYLRANSEEGGNYLTIADEDVMTEIRAMPSVAIGRYETAKLLYFDHTKSGLTAGIAEPADDAGNWGTGRIRLLGRVAKFTKDRGCEVQLHRSKVVFPPICVLLARYGARSAFPLIKELMEGFKTTDEVQRINITSEYIMAFLKMYLEHCHGMKIAGTMAFNVGVIKCPTRTHAIFVLVNSEGVFSTLKTVAMRRGAYNQHISITLLGKEIKLSPENYYQTLSITMEHDIVH